MTDVAAIHPAYSGASDEKRWASSPAFLFDTLATEAARHPTSEADRALDGGWAWRILPDGVVVGLRAVGKPIHGIRRMELRIAGDAGTSEWDGRRAELVRTLGIRLSTGERPCPYMGALWSPLPLGPRDEGKLVARYVSLAPGES